MSVDSVVDSAITNILRTARQDFEQSFPRPAVRPGSININFSGGGSVLRAGMPTMCRIPYPCVIQSVEIYAGIETGQPAISPLVTTLTTAYVDLWLVSSINFANSGQTPMHPAYSGPRLVDQAYAEWDILEASVTNLIATDRLVARINSIVGSATWLSVLIQVLPTDVPQGTAEIVDPTLEVIVDDEGNEIVYRV